MSYLFSNFRRHSWDVSALVQNNLRFLVCLSVCSISHFLTENRLTVDIYSSGWASFLKFSGDIPGIVCTLVPNNFRFLLCEFFVFTGVNFETSGLVWQTWWVFHQHSDISQTWWNLTWNFLRKDEFWLWEVGVV